MDKIEKLLKKISKKDRQVLLVLISKIVSNDKSIRLVKITNTDFYRVRSGRFRLIIHKEGNEVIIDSIRLRNDNTYKNI
jgi:mRNA-degrading endonuclease RelE of RelBE toxin-antitoxin system